MKSDLHDANSITQDSRERERENHSLTNNKHLTKLNFKHDLIRFIDLFAGLGGFRVAFEEITSQLNIPAKCVFVSEIDKEVIKTYSKNFDAKNEKFIDIKAINPKDIPDHDFLFAGFPCQTFSNAGKKKGFSDESRGTLFFNICEILKVKKPKYALLENVKHIVSHDNGQTWLTTVQELKKIGYIIPEKPLILNPVDFGVPQDCKRVFIPMVLKNKIKHNVKNLDVDLSKFHDKFFQGKTDFLKIRKKIESDFLDKRIPKKYWLKQNDYLVHVFSAWDEFIKNVKTNDQKKHYHLFD